MQTEAKRHKFIGKVLSEGNLSIPECVAKEPGSKFEIVRTPVAHINDTANQRLFGGLRKPCKFTDMKFSAAEIEEINSEIFETFSTEDVDAIIDLSTKRR